MISAARATAGVSPICSMRELAIFSVVMLAGSNLRYSSLPKNRPFAGALIDEDGQFG